MSNLSKMETGSESIGRELVPYTKEDGSNGALHLNSWEF